MTFEQIVLVLCFVIVVVIVLGIIINKVKSSIIIDEIHLVCNEKKLEFREIKKGVHDLEIEGNDFILFVKCITIPSNSSVTVNSKDTWCLRFGGHRVGRSYPNKRYLNELIPFLNQKYSHIKKVQKVVVLNPSTEKVLKYINESEIIELSSNDEAYNVKIIQFNKLKEEFNNLL